MAATNTRSNLLYQRPHQKAVVDDNKQRQERIGDFHPVKRHG